MTSIKDRLAAAKLPERSLQVCLRGDLRAEFDALELQLRDARQSSGRKRMSERPEAAQIAEKMATLQDEMADAMLDLTVRALPRREWQRLYREHPPEPDRPGDVAVGVALDDFMAVVVPLCVVEPVLDAEDWARLDETLASADYDRIFNAVWEVNRSGVDVPKSQLASLVMNEGGVGSK